MQLEERKLSAAAAHRPPFSLSLPSSLYTRTSETVTLARSWSVIMF